MVVNSGERYELLVVGMIAPSDLLEVLEQKFDVEVVALEDGEAMLIVRKKGKRT